MKVKGEREVAQPCLTLSDPTDRSLPGSSIHGIFQARVLQWVAIALSDSCSIVTPKKELLAGFTLIRCLCIMFLSFNIFVMKTL